VEDAAIPDLGPIPQSSPISSKSGGDGASSRDSDDSSGSESDSDEEDEEDDGAIDEDDEDEYNEKSGRKAGDAARASRPRTRRSLSGKDAGEGGKKDDSTRVSSDETPKTDDVPKQRKRGRPPKIDTPEEARIRSILRAIRKVKDDDGRQLFTEFEKLPDPDQYPDYYNEIKKPIALDQITVLHQYWKRGLLGRGRSRDGITARWRPLSPI
jgi:chromatin structure-remodeling complex subunit RSC1/2